MISTGEPVNEYTLHSAVMNEHLLFADTPGAGEL